MIALRFDARNSSAAIAGNLGITDSAVRTTLMRARNALRQCIETRLTETKIMRALS